MKQDECDLLLALLDRPRYPQPGELVRDIIARLDIPPNRARYILRKWENGGLYDYGTSYDLGWLTVEGRRAAERELRKVEA